MQEHSFLNDVLLVLTAMNQVLPQLMNVTNARLAITVHTTAHRTHYPVPMEHTVRTAQYILNGVKPVIIVLKLLLRSHVQVVSTVRTLQQCAFHVQWAIIVLVMTTAH